MKTPCISPDTCRGVVALLLVAAAAACSGQQEAAPPATPSATDAAIPDTASPYDALPEGVRLVLDKPFTGDFDAMVKRRAIRVAVTYNRTHYFLDKGQERGITYESLKLFENNLNADLKTGNLKVHVVMVPMSRDQLYPALASGKVDMVAAMVTVTPEREKLVAFSEPTRTNVSEVVVTGPGAPPIATVDDLAGQEVFVRKGSIYDESLVRLNDRTESARQGAGRHRRLPPTCSKTMTCSRWSTPASRRLPWWTTISPSSGARCSPTSRSIRTSPCGPAAAWRSRFARRIPGSERSSTRGFGSTSRATPSATWSNAAI